MDSRSLLPRDFALTNGFGNRVQSVLPWKIYPRCGLERWREVAGSHVFSDMTCTAKRSREKARCLHEEERLKGVGLACIGTERGRNAPKGIRKRSLVKNAEHVAQYSLNIIITEYPLRHS